MGKEKGIPELRFPGFEGRWRVFKLGNIATFLKGRGVAKTDVVIDGDTECIRYGELYTLYGETVDKVYSKTSQNPNSLFFSEVNDVIIPSSGETRSDIAKASCVIRSGVALGGDINVIRTPHNGVFLSYYINSAKRKDITRMAQGISVIHLYSSQLSSLILNLPTLPEQQKIASFFTAIDQKISQLKQKHELLEQYKKGVMQKIFSQQIRFRDDDGMEFPKWEKKRLGEVAIITTGLSNRKDSIIGGQYTFFDRSQDIRTSNRFLFDKEAVIVPGEGKEFIPKYFIGKFDLHQRTYAIFDFSGILGKYLYYHLLYTDKHLQAQAVGSTVKSLRLPIFKSMPIKLPQLKEQTKIANFLSAIDDKIQYTQKQIDQTEQWKKGLMQRMFV